MSPELDNNITYNQLKETYPNLFPSLDECFETKANDSYPTLDLPDYYAKLGLLLDFDWILCPREKRTLNISTGWDKALETIHYTGAYDESFQYFKQEALNTSGVTSNSEAVEYALMHATGGDKCHPHLAAGAFFWFTIMTTVGYGNAAPITGGGRALVFTVGFVSIIAFTALTGKAGYVTITIVDDAFNRNRWLRPLSRGLPAVLFWFVVLVLWILFVAQMGRIYDMRRRDEEVLDSFPLDDAIWFSYITMTTVGLGDIHVGHEEIRWGDMFYLPLLMLFGFVWLANFAVKLGTFVVHIWPEDETLEEILEEQGSEHREES
eukprot:CAMPEP_0194061478 /NCGR_PEP_ID=MMETSP0009_2-20130614/74747_1 /TAXON_ID=210454 /ORGANISM="Grammatophora oceanica, Strain CCMP 410" /LENGTH=320 /DNA_ID=CAMNT_0038712803 /DNA_START=270 /DNA_END=1233 /DNA_ORIENTATION=+